VTQNLNMFSSVASFDFGPKNENQSLKRHTIDNRIIMLMACEIGPPSILSKIISISEKKK